MSPNYEHKFVDGRTITTNTETGRQSALSESLRASERVFYCGNIYTVVAVVCDGTDVLVELYDSYLVDTFVISCQRWTPFVLVPAAS